MQEHELLTTAARFVNATASHIFLTGKAGTGKTTFLRNLAQSTHKRFAIVAPTGIAALNAGGVTIHSQFQLPTGFFAPEEINPADLPGNFSVITPRTLSYKHPVSAAKKKVLREIDLLIVDEVSMLRADVLDAMDHRLKSIRRNFNVPFGGVQLLFIGDLFQLPPVVKDRDRALLHRFYASPFFYEAHALKQTELVYIELEKIFRQADDAFIRILNNIREDRLSKADVDALNTFYHPKRNRDADVITLTTHNKQADSINRTELEKLEGPSYFYEAVIVDDFPESMYPVDATLELREGARIMFTKNDAVNHRYFNGKMATVSELKKDEITVLIDDDPDPYTLEKSTWENKKYELGKASNELEENIVGKFKHYPIKLAWAITIHKSQGLTFERASIDVGKAFASGQVYVALSRLKSLEGLVLESPIDPAVVSNDDAVLAFSSNKLSQEQLAEILPEREKAYLLNLLLSTFSFEELINTASTLLKKHNFGQFESDTVQRCLPELRSAWQAQRKNLSVFTGQLHRLLHENDSKAFEERLSKGAGYYIALVKEQAKQFALFIEEVRAYSKTKTIVNDLEEVEQGLLNKWFDFQNVQVTGTGILNGAPIDAKTGSKKAIAAAYKEMRQKASMQAELTAGKSKRKSGRKRTVKTGESTKGETYIKTLNLLKEGMTPDEIADKRGMAESTIHGHVSKLIGAGEIKITDVMSPDRVDTILHAMETISYSSLSELKEALNGDYEYNELRLVLAHRAKQMREES